MSETSEALMSKGVFDRLQWIKENYPDFKVEDRFLPYLECAERNTPISGEETEEDDWVPVASVQDLKDMRPITHELWFVLEQEDRDHWAEVAKDIKGGVTFAFFWQEDALCWER